MSLLRRTARRQGLPPSEQRALWAREAAGSAAHLAGFRFPQRDSRRLKVISMNVYYGQVASSDGVPMAPAIDVSSYADLFAAGADVVAMQEAVLTRLPPRHPLINTAETYAARDGPGQSHWKDWTRRFPPARCCSSTPTSRRRTPGAPRPVSARSTT